MKKVKNKRIIIKIYLKRKLFPAFEFEAETIRTFDELLDAINESNFVIKFHQIIFLKLDFKKAIVTIK